MRAPRTIAALVAVAAAVAATACGSSSDLPKDIPPDTANSLLSNLNLVAADCETGDTAAVQSAVGDYMTALEGVPDSVNPDVRKILTETSARLQSLAQDGTGCQSGATGATGLSGSIPSDTSGTSASTAAPTTTDETTSTTAPSTQPEQPTPPANPPNQNHGEGHPPIGGGSGGIGAG